MSSITNNKYTFLKLLETYSIEIPIIQRDYVQGRKKEAIVRENFLNAIYEKLIKDEKLHLDFVYGVIKNNKFIPLDGQQRLTTLFLIHYFVALKENKFNDFQKYLKNKDSIKFTYETRRSSKEFCEQLINNRINLYCDLEGEKEIAISKIIKDENWFFSKWEQDPTISSMLIMLDEIQTIFQVENLFDKLKTNITFSFLEPKKLNIKNADELYIKMNSRGKPLNEFENFKSYFTSFLSDENKIKFDNDWFDIFWNLRKDELKADNTNNEEMIENKIFGAYLNFFKNIIAFYSDEFNEVDIFKFDYTNKISDICKILDCLKGYQDSQTNEIRENLKLFESFLQNEKDISYADRIKFYMLIVFFLKKGLPSKYSNIFKSWARVNINIIHNTAYDNIQDFKNNMNFIDSLSEHIDNLYEFLSTNNFSDNISDQLREEIEKATIIKPQNDWETYFLDAEKYNYLDGKINFLIDISKQEDINKEVFKQYKTKFEILWDFVSNKKDKKENEMLLHRALLTFGKYLPNKKDSNKYTFGSFGVGLREKNENWRRIFKKEEFKKLLDKLNCKNIKNELTSIVDKFKFNCNDWKSYFINPNKEWTPISYANYYHIKIDNNAIFLNNGSSKATGWGWSRVYEMHSIYLLQNIQEKLNSFEPFLEIYPHPSSNIDETYPYIAIENWKIKDDYSFEINIIYNKKYIIEFFEKNNKQIPNKIIEILKSFDIDNETYDITVYKNEQYGLCKQNDLIVFLENLLKQFKEIDNDSL